MNWVTLKISLPYGVAGALMAMGGVIGIDAKDFNFFDWKSISNVISMGIGGFLVSYGIHLRGLKTPVPWDGKERRNIEDLVP